MLRSLHGLGSLSLLLYAILAVLSHQQTPSIWIFILIQVGLWGIFFRLLSERSEVRTTIRTILLWAIAFRVIGVFAMPLFEDDYFRFLWDGYVFATVGDPYNLPPSEYFGKPLDDTWDAILTGVNYPSYPTVYGPVIEWIFLLSYHLNPGSLITLKAVFLLFDVLVFLFLYPFLNKRGVAALVWCPLFVFESTFNAHPESIPIAFCVAAYAAMKCKKFMLAGVVAGIAFSAKFFAILLVPFIIWKSRFRAVLPFFLAVFLCYAPFSDSSGFGNFEAVVLMGKSWEFNSFLFGILKYFVGWDSAKLVCLFVSLLVCALCFTLWVSKKTRIEAVLYFIFIACILCSPVINPWYLLWTLPWASSNPRVSSLLPLALVSLSYIHGGVLTDSNLPMFHHPLWVRVIEFTLINFALLHEISTKFKNRNQYSGMNTI